jgi:hypothetical protein
VSLSPERASALAAGVRSLVEAAEADGAGAGDVELTVLVHRSSGTTRR